MRSTAFAPLLALCLALTGCGGDDGDLQQFVAQVKARPAAPIEPMPKIATYTPFSYVAGGRRDPFSAPQQADAGKPRHNGVAPNRNRPRDPLEQFPLDTLHLVGTITTGGIEYALVRAPDNIIYRVARGDHAGQNYGEIRSVTEQGVVLTEIVPDGTGGYVKRAATIAPAG